MVVIAAMLTATAGEAAATTATVTPGGTVTLTATTSARITLGSTTVSCTSTTASGSLGNASGALPLTISTNLLPAFAGCTLPGGVPWTFACTASNLEVTGVTAASVTPGSIRNVRCRISVSASCHVDLVGAIPLSYNNVSHGLTLPTAGQTLVSAGSTCISTLPNGVATITTNTGSALMMNVAPSTTIVVV